MLIFLDDMLVRCAPEPVIPGEFKLRYNAAELRVELWHGFERVEAGVRYYGKKAQVDPKTGQILSLESKFNSIRAVFGGQHLEITLDFAPDQSPNAPGSPTDRVA